MTVKATVDILLTGAGVLPPGSRAPTSGILRATVTAPSAELLTLALTRLDGMTASDDTALVSVEGATAAELDFDSVGTAGGHTYLPLDAEPHVTLVAVPKVTLVPA